MTVGPTPSRVRYAGDGISTEFPVPFAFIDAADLEVIARPAGGAETVLALDVDYTVSGGGGGAGTVHAAAAPAASVDWVIRRSTARAQETDYTANDPFPAETHERALDRLTMIAQEQDEALGRVPTLPKSSPLTALQLPEPTASALLAWNGAGDAIVNTLAADAGLVAASPLGATLVAEPDAPAMRSTLGLVIGSDVQAHDARLVPNDHVSVSRGGVDQTGIPAITATKVAFTTAEHDDNGYFDTVTNHRFQPTVASTWLVMLQVRMQLFTAGALNVSIWKNGVQVAQRQSQRTGAITVDVSRLVTFNGFSDYVEGYAYHSDTGNERDIKGYEDSTYLECIRLA